MICQSPVHLPLIVGNGVKTVYDFLAAVFHLAVNFIHPVVIKREVYPVISIGALDSCIEYAECLLISLHIVCQVHRTHIVPLLVVYLISNNPVGHFAIVRIFSAVMVCQKSRNRSGLFIARLISCIKHIVKSVRGFFCTWIDQIRAAVVPVI